MEEAEYQTMRDRVMEEADGLVLQVLIIFVGLFLAVILVFTACKPRPVTESVEPPKAPVVQIKFIHPAARIVLSGPRGVEIPVQAWIERHPDNKLFQLEWARHGEKPQIFAKTADGEYEARLFPIEPINIRLTHGDWEIRALACSAERNGLCAQVRARAVMPFKVCGGMEECL